MYGERQSGAESTYAVEERQRTRVALQTGGAGRVVLRVRSGQPRNLTEDGEERHKKNRQDSFCGPAAR